MAYLRLSLKLYTAINTESFDFDFWNLALTPNIGNSTCLFNTQRTYALELCGWTEESSKLAVDRGKDSEWDWVSAHVSLFP